MFNHAPEGYQCPFCHFLSGKPDKYNNEDDIVYRNDMVTAFIAPGTWPNNKGHVLVVPNKHYENLYDIPEADLAEIYKTVKQIAIALRTT